MQLTDFPVCYSQDSADAAAASIKEKGSKIVIEKGQIVKISKDAQGIVTREQLTKHWTDWIDYWSVDFDFENKREVIRVRKEINPSDVGQVSNLPVFKSETHGRLETCPTVTPAQKRLEEWEEVWTDDFIFENEWQSFRTKKDRSLELTSAAREVDKDKKRVKIAVKVVFAQREAFETIVYLYDVIDVKDKFNLLRFDSSGTVSTGMFDESWRRFVVKIATGSGKTKPLDAALAAIVVDRPDPEDHEQHLCLDKGYDNPTGEAAVAKHQCVPHIRRIGEDAKARKHKRSKPRRCVVKRTLGWLSKCRALLVRYGKNWSNHLGLIQLACAMLWYRRTHRLGAG